MDIILLSFPPTSLQSPLLDRAVGRQCLTRTSAFYVPVLNTTLALDRTVFRSVATSHTGTTGHYHGTHNQQRSKHRTQTLAFWAWPVANKGIDSFWTKVGVAWPHRDGKGQSSILSVIPMNGQIVLRQSLLPL
jgi:hypothetical protein